MRDIQEIMKKMDNLSDEIAVTCADACSDAGTSGEFICDNATDTDIPFSCTLTIPQGFIFNHLVGAESPNNPRIAYNLDCLHAFVQPCFCPNSSTARFAIRVVGCISYIVNLRVLTDSSTDVCVAAANNTPGTTPEIFVCCHDSVCVDTTVCFACIPEQAYTQLGIIRSRLEDACGIGVVFNPPVTCGNPAVAVTVSGNFILPDCSVAADA